MYLLVSFAVFELAPEKKREGACESKEADPERGKGTNVGFLDDEESTDSKTPQSFQDSVLIHVRSPPEETVDVDEISETTEPISDGIERASELHLQTHKYSPG